MRAEQGRGGDDPLPAWCVQSAFSRLGQLCLWLTKTSSHDQRIARYDYCWRDFIPKTKKATRYCDRVADGQTCKQRGANLARSDATEEDEALLICKKLRDRMYSRLLRYQDAAPWERGKFIPMSLGDYDAWSEDARVARSLDFDPEVFYPETLQYLNLTPGADNE